MRWSMFLYWDVAEDKSTHMLREPGTGKIYAHIRKLPVGESVYWEAHVLNAPKATSFNKIASCPRGVEGVRVGEKVLGYEGILDNYVVKREAYKTVTAAQYACLKVLSLLGVVYYSATPPPGGYVASLPVSKR